MEMATDVVVSVESGKRQSNEQVCCKATGPGYASPREAMAGPREALIYVTCVYTGRYFSISHTLGFSALIFWIIVFQIPVSIFA